MIHEGKKKLKVLFVTPCIGFHEYKFVKSLSNNGYKTIIFSFHKESVDERIEKLNNVIIIYHKLRILPRLQRFLPFHMICKLRKVYSKFKPDIVHSGNTWNDSLICAFANLHPLLVMPYGSDILVDPSKFFIFKLLNHYVFKHADWVTCDANYVKEKIYNDYKYPKKKITVIPWGIDLSLINHFEGLDRNLFKNNFVIIMTRKHDKIYGIDLFIKAVNIAIKKDPSIRVILIGSGPLHDKYIKMIKNFGLIDYFKIFGEIDNKELLRWLGISNLYVSSSYSDGTSVSLLEAMGMGLPVICTDLPSNREYIRTGYNGELFDAGNYEQLSKKILKLSSDKLILEEYGKINREIVKNRANWEDNFNKLKKIYYFFSKRKTQ